MKLVKFKDIYNPKDHNYNMFLRNKTAYLIDYRYVVPLEFIDPKDAWLWDREIDERFLREHLHGEKKVFWDTYKDPYITEMIDILATAELNDLLPGKKFHMHFPEYRIPISELKRFRTWLATALTVFTQPHEEAWRHVLHYYAHGMYDETMKWLSIFGSGSEVKPKRKDCYCGSSAQKSALDSKCGCGESKSESIMTCNTINMYRLGIYNTMVDRFSTVQFWAVLPESFLREFKRYIDNILRSGLVVNTVTTHVSVYANCNCPDLRTENEMFFRGVMERLSASIQHIIDKDVTGHINFIAKALKEFSSMLYEKMEWD